MSYVPARALTMDTRSLRAVLGLLVTVAVAAGSAAPASAAPAYRAHAQANGTINWGGGSATVARPAGTANTDLLIATIRASATWNVTDTAWATSHGWSLLQDNGDAGKTYYRTAGAAASYTLLSWGSATFPLENWVATITAFSGVDLTAPVVGTGTAANGSGATAALPNATADRDGSMRFTATMINNTTATTFSAGLTKAADIGASSMGIAGAWELQDTGATPARTASWGASRTWIAHTLILRGSESVPTVTGLAPVAGPATGGTEVTITGTNFSSTTAVTFGAASAASFVVDSSTQIRATAPAGAPGSVDVRVTNSGGQSANTAADDFTFVAAPAVTSVSPSSGPTGGGTAVTITGTNLSGASAVSFGGTPASSFTVDSATQITATAPARGAGIADVRVTTLGGQSANTAADDYTYVAAPAVSGLAPSSGPTTGGTAVVITGTSFTGVSSVTFGGVNASAYVVNSATQITATAPAGVAGVVDVQVTATGGQSANTAADDFTFVAAPAVTSVSPSSGPTGGGTAVTITGTNLSGASAVSFGGTPASSFTVDSATQITATAPARVPGTVAVRVTTVGGQSPDTAADDYTYVAAPTVALLVPNHGPLAGGTSVTITGTGLAGTSAVTFGGTSAASFTVISPTEITATAPARGSSGLVDVRVTTAGGLSANTPADDYLYEDPCGGGALELSFPDFGFDPLTLNGLDRTGTKQITVPAADLTNLGLGWKVQIGTGRFETAGGARLPADAARIAGVAAASVSGTCVPPSNGVTGYPITLPQDPAKVTIFNASAGTGLGPASLDINAELDVPANAATGTYTSTWTVDLTAAP